MTRAYLRSAVAALALLTAASACEGDEPQPLSADERKLVSRMYADTVAALQTDIDSLCLRENPTLVAELTDSLYRERVADVERQDKRAAR